VKRRGFIKTWIWGEDPADKLERTRLIVIEEGKIITMKQIPECQRKYGEYFETAADDKI